MISVCRSGAGDFDRVVDEDHLSGPGFRLFYAVRAGVVPSFASVCADRPSPPVRQFTVRNNARRALRLAAQKDGFRRGLTRVDGSPTLTRDTQGPLVVGVKGARYAWILRHWMVVVPGWHRFPHPRRRLERWRILGCRGFHPLPAPAALRSTLDPSGPVEVGDFRCRRPAE